MRELIRKLTEAYGPSGAEEEIRAIIRTEVEPLSDEVRVDPLGSLVARKEGSPSTGSGQAGKRIVLAAHMDEIGVMATYVDEKGFARFTNIGGVRTLNCVGGRVAFADGTLGVIGVEQKRSNADKVPQMAQLYIDVGAASRDDCPVQVGDAAVFVRSFAAQGTRLIAKAMDDRIGCAVLIEALRRLKKTLYDLYLIFTTQEEVGLRGARTSVYGIEPDLATYGKVIGGGMPVGAYGGRRELMEQLAPLGPVYQAGTLSGNPVSMAAGVATLRELLADDGAAYDRLETLGAALAQGIQEAFTRHRAPWSVVRVGSILWLVLQDGEAPRRFEHIRPENADVYARLQRPDIRSSYISAATIGRDGPHLLHYRGRPSILPGHDRSCLVAGAGTRSDGL